jgi:alanyl-tRNA synthetase
MWLVQAAQLRQHRQDFWEGKAPLHRKHQYVNPANLVVNTAQDPTTMFNSAGMQPLVPYLMGKPHPDGKRLYNIQWCVRTWDIDEVGDATHLTYFEMMGNRSLGDYFKKEAIERSREFLTSKEWLGLDPRKIAVTVFAGDENAPRDQESAQCRMDVSKGTLEWRISFMTAKDNRRSPWPVGPCWPDTEIFYWRWKSEFPPLWSTVENDDAQWMEIWNNVFMAYHRNEQWVLQPLNNKNVDTWMGFERMCTVMQWVDTIYETDIFAPLLGILQNYTRVSYEKNPTHSRIIADHIRTASMLLAEWLTPTNEGRWYVLRRIIRRMYYHLYVLLSDEKADEKTKSTRLHECIHELVMQITTTYTQLANKATTIIEWLIQEITQFQKTIRTWQQKLDEILSRSKHLTGKDIFLLYDTYGLPAELTREIVEGRGGTLDLEAFLIEKKNAQERSRRASQHMFAKSIDRSVHIEGIPPTRFVGYATTQTTSVTLLKDFNIDDIRIIIVDQTPFYAEWGGQTSDTGIMILDDGTELHVEHVMRYAGVYLHVVQSPWQQST